MSKPYSQLKALWAITRASFKAIFSQPTAVVFSLLFPIIFILIFGAFGSGGLDSFKIAVQPGSDTSLGFYTALKSNPQLKLQHYTDTTRMESELVKGQLTAIVHIGKTMDGSRQEKYLVTIKSTSASGNTLPGFLQSLDYTKLRFEAEVDRDREDLVVIPPPTITDGQKYRQIDFILPGQIGFSLLFATLFGVAFTFYSLREQLVLKRFYASPVNKINILVGIGMSRLFFQLVNVVVLILFGHFFLDFTLQHGALTFVEMVVLSIVMLFLLMGVGLIFSSIVKSDATIPLLINLFGFPQMLLSGTFFSISVFPKWLQDICYFLPLTQFNDAMRKISFEGLHLYDCGVQLGILGAWIILIYAVLSRVIKWE